MTKVNELVPDKDGKTFLAHITLWSWWVGLKVRDERYMARLCNIDRDTLLAEEETAKEARQDLFRKLILAQDKIYHAEQGRVVMYADPAIFSVLKIAALEKANMALGYSDIREDRRILSFMGIPIKKNDVQKTAEKKVS